VADRLTTGGTGAYVVGGLQEHETSQILCIGALENRIRDDHSETQASVQLVSADLSDTDTLTFRINQEHKGGANDITGLAVITVEKGGGAASFTENMTDELGMDEIFLTVAGFIITFIDELGAEDTMSIGLSAAFEDEMGIDSVFEDLFGSRKDFTDELALDEIFDREVSVTNSFIDELGLEDTQEKTTGFVQPFTDEMGLDEIFVTRLGFTNSFPDDLGLEDTLATVGSFNIGFIDELGIEDIIAEEHTGAQSNTENVFDDLGLEDIIVRQLESNVEGFIDELGMDEIFVTAKGHTESFIDELGLEDTLAIEKSISESFTDDLGLDENFNTSGGTLVEFTDELGLEDTLATAAGFGIIIQGSDIGLDDFINVSKGNTVNLIDELGMEDSFEFQLGVIYFTDSLGLDEDFSNTTPTGLVFNAIVLSINSPEFDRLGGVFAVICPTNSTLTGLLLNGTFVCTDMSAFFP